MTNNKGITHYAPQQYPAPVACRNRKAHIGVRTVEAFLKASKPCKRCAVTVNRIVHKRYPEIFTLNLADARAALVMGINNRGGLKPEYVPEFDARLLALCARCKEHGYTEAGLLEVEAALIGGTL